MPHQVFGAVAGDCIINTCIVLGDESQHQHPLWEPDTDPTRSPRPELPRPSRKHQCHIRSLPTALIRRLKDLAETSIITIIIKTDLRFIINHLDQCCIHTTTMFSIGGEIAISMPCLRVSWRAKEN
ncbi:unnamed protein product [Microthlaspi erraticum]|uniref:Uncharacterized protein n=1 Tax=Microthlaspi erraticum TaxID=1685480 RepID=A0A6D2L4D5_9BRAS|nr:unnamed protein product [Microthlaspi erraticum]